MKKLFSSIFKRFKKFKNKLKRKKRRILLFFLLIWSLKVSPVKADVPPGPDANPPNLPGHLNGFFPITPPGKPQKKVKDDLNIQIKKKDKIYDVILKDEQVRAKYEHANVFGVPGKPCRPNFQLFKVKLVDHIIDPSTEVIEGTYRKTTEVFHFFNRSTELNVMVCKDDNTFLSGWKLSTQQIKNVLERGSL
jgi:hypothetical protein